MSDDPMICYCKRVTRAQIVAAIRKGARSLRDIQRQTAAATGNRCKELNPKGVCCAPDVREILEQETGRKDDTPCCATGPCGCSTGA